MDSRIVLPAIACAALALAAYAASFAAAPPDRTANHSIMVSFRYKGTCIGMCPCFDTMVRNDGTVATRSCDSNPQENWDYSIAPADVEKFREVLRPLRFGPRRRGSCTPPGQMTDREVKQMVIWTDARPSSLISCYDLRVRDTIEDALLAIGASPYTGVKLTPAHRDQLRKSMVDDRRYR